MAHGVGFFPIFHFCWFTFTAATQTQTSSLQTAKKGNFSHYHFSLFTIFHRATTAPSLCALCTAIWCTMNGKIIHSHLDRPMCVSAVCAWNFKWHFVLISKSLACLWMVEFLVCAQRFPSESESSKVKVKWTGKCSPADGQRWKYRRNRSWTHSIRMKDDAIPNALIAIYPFNGESEKSCSMFLLQSLWWVAVKICRN